MLSSLAVSGFPDAPFAHAKTPQRADRPFAPLLNGKPDITVMPENFLALLEPRLFTRIRAAFPLDQLWPCPETHAATPLPGYIGVTGVVCEAPHRVNGTDFRASVGPLLRGCGS